MHKYRLVAKKGEGTFSEVLKAQCIKNGKYVAIKCMKNHFDSLDQVNNLREIQALRRLSPHPHIIKLVEVLYDQPTGRLALVFELMDMNIYELIRGRRHYVAEDRIKNYMYQLMKAMDHMHRNGIFHRDIKPENILIMDDCLKLADFGSCRGIYSKQPYTEYISTRWYRAPECLLTDGYYNYKMDMWGVGCVFFEIVSLFPLFPGTNELDQIQKIHNILGTPPAELLAKMKKRSQHMDFNFPSKEGSGIPKLIPHVPAECIDLICKLLAYNPDDRLSARQALRHSYFRDLRETEKRQKAMLSPESTPGSANNSFHREGSTAASGMLPGLTAEPSGKLLGAGKHPSSPTGSDVEEGHQSSSLRRMSDNNGGLPSIKANTNTHQDSHAGGHHHDSDGSGLEQNGLDEGNASLPPIGGGLPKMNSSSNVAANGSTARRTSLVPPSYYDGPAYAAKAGAAGAGAAAAAAPAAKGATNAATGAKRQGAGGKYGNKAPAGSSLASQSSVKFNKAKGASGASNSAVGVAGKQAGGGKYISPSSLRNLAVQEQA